MQFYLNGYNPGDPDIHAAAPGAENRTPDLPATVDVLIVGNGPAGTVLAAQLSTFPSITTRLGCQFQRLRELSVADARRQIDERFSRDLRRVKKQLLGLVARVRRALAGKRLCAFHKVHVDWDFDFQHVDAVSLFAEFV